MRRSKSGSLVGAGWRCQTGRLSKGTAPT